MGLDRFHGPISGRMYRRPEHPERKIIISSSRPKKPKITEVKIEEIVGNDLTE